MNTNDLAHEMSDIHDITLAAAREGVATYLAQLADLGDQPVSGRDGSHDELADAATQAVREAFAAEYR